jgi:hypothetical protein
MGDGPPSANPDTAIDFAPGAPEGKGEEPSRRQRVGPWAPVIPLKVGPHVAGGDKCGSVRQIGGSSGFSVGLDWQLEGRRLA